MTTGEFLNTVSPLFPGLVSVAQTVALGVICAIVLTPAERWAPAHPQPLLFRKGLLLDIVYWFATPLLTRCTTAAALAAVLLIVLLCIGPEQLPKDFLIGGFGPLGRQPGWLQALEILFLSDFVDYWTHRGLHRGRWWRIHAIHHSPEEMNWISSSRVHPLNDLITRSCQVLPVVLLGFAATSVMAVVPLVSFYVMFLHSNVRWDFGPLRWVLVSPAYHRWHHTSDDEGIDKNFAGIFPIWDLIFGTAHFPKTLPVKYGLVGYQMPESFWAHLVYPFTRRQSASIMGRHVEEEKKVEEGGGRG
ncbi:MAG: sterol desaturase family protein [Planctomycetes bacterium]|nr:sterol desaturase family protein [Planctomycetota bacterium]